MRESRRIGGNLPGNPPNSLRQHYLDQVQRFTPHSAVSQPGFAQAPEKLYDLSEIVGSWQNAVKLIVLLLFAPDALAGRWEQ